MMSSLPGNEVLDDGVSKLESVMLKDLLERLSVFLTSLGR
jgi:hypothetical protein